jgi:glycosyltransferase involved in cell wall biosynthesis
MLLLDLTHTAHTRARTGIQRVARTLWSRLGEEAQPVCLDKYLGSWRKLDPWELESLAEDQPGTRRGTRWPLRARLGGYLGRLGGRGRGLNTTAGGLIVPEIPSRSVSRAHPALFAAVQGPRTAIFYDALPLTHPEFTPQGTVALFPGYLQDLLAFDGIAAISRDSRDALLGYWEWLGVRDHPPVEAITLGLAAPPAPRPDPGEPATRPAVATVLSVGTIEGRKNHVALLEACERLWRRGHGFGLRLIGMAQLETGGPALARIDELKRAGRPLRYDGPVGDAELEEAYSECAFTVYPSLAEGFGLPVLESVARGRACVCLGRGALGEVALEGGCLAVPSVDAASLEGAIACLLGDPGRLAGLEAEARARVLKSWDDYVRELTGWMGSLKRRKG